MFFHSSEQLKPVEEKINFWIILCLSRNPVLSNKKKFSPFFFETVGPIGLKLFLQILDANRGACFFSFLEILFLSILAAITKFRKSKNPWFLTRPSAFCFSWPVKTIFFKRKKNTRPDFRLVFVEKFSARSDELSNFVGGKTFGHSWPLWPPKLCEGSIWEFCFYDELFSTHRDLSTLRVS